MSRDPASLPDWPESMGVETAAAFCDLSPAHFQRHCPVPAFRIGRRKLWHRASLAAWLRTQAGIQATEADGTDDWLEAARRG